MLHSAEAAHGGGDGSVLYTGPRRGDRRRERIFDIVAAADRDFARLHQQLAEQHQLVAAESRARVYLLAAAEPMHGRTGPRRVGDADRILGIEHRVILGLLGLEQAAPDSGVIFESMMPVQVI